MIAQTANDAPVVPETFPLLAHAPIVEAVIDIRTTCSDELKEEDAKARVEKSLPDYQFIDSRKEIQHALTFRVDEIKVGFGDLR